MIQVVVHSTLLLWVLFIPHIQLLQFTVPLIAKLLYYKNCCASQTLYLKWIVLDLHCGISGNQYVTSIYVNVAVRWYRNYAWLVNIG